MLHSFNGTQIITDRNMVDPVEDWSGVRSKSRAARRRRQGYRQRIVIRYVPKKEIFQMGNKLVMHPDMVKELEHQISR